jgi:hypothetical protein
VKCVENAIDVVSLPGASSTITALVASGLPTDQFRFFGFPPQKKGRQTFLQNLANSDCTSIIFESPYKIEKIIDELIEYCGIQRRICFARELTKVFEEYIRGTLIECKEALKSKSSIKGEFVIILEGKKMKNFEANRILKVETSIFATMSQLAIKHKAVNLGQGFPDFDGPAWIMEEAYKAMKNGKNQYAPMNGTLTFRNAISNVYKNYYSLDFNPDTEITVTAGATEALYFYF